MESEAKCPKCGGAVGTSGWCVRCDKLPPMTDEQLHHVVGGMAVLSGISIGIGLLGLYQRAKIRRERAGR